MACLSGSIVRLEENRIEYEDAICLYILKIQFKCHREHRILALEYGIHFTEHTPMAVAVAVDRGAAKPQEVPFPL